MSSPYDVLIIGSGAVFGPAFCAASASGNSTLELADSAPATRCAIARCVALASSRRLSISALGVRRSSSPNFRLSRTVRCG